MADLCAPGIEREERAAETLVLALGNPLRGDDGVGIAVLERLRESPALPPDVQLVDGGTAGVHIALLIEGYGRVIVVDSADLGGEPGAHLRFTLKDAALLSDDAALSAHNSGLGEALRLCEALDMLPAEIVIYGIQPEVVGWQSGLSDPVQRAIPPVCEAILRELCEERI